jgi:hypothetical protein
VEAVTSGWLTDVLAAVLVVHLLQKEVIKKILCIVRLDTEKPIPQAFKTPRPFFYRLTKAEQANCASLHHLLKYKARSEIKRFAWKRDDQSLIMSPGLRSELRNPFKAGFAFYSRLHALCCTPAQCACMNRLPRPENPTWRKKIPNTHSFLLRSVRNSRQMYNDDTRRRLLFFNFTIKKKQP